MHLYFAFVAAVFFYSFIYFDLLYSSDGFAENSSEVLSPNQVDAISNSSSRRFMEYPVDRLLPGDTFSPQRLTDDPSTAARQHPHQHYNDLDLDSRAYAPNVAPKPHFAPSTDIGYPDEGEAQPMSRAAIAQLSKQGFMAVDPSGTRRKTSRHAGLLASDPERPMASRYQVVLQLAAFVPARETTSANNSVPRAAIFTMQFFNCEPKKTEALRLYAKGDTNSRRRDRADLSSDDERRNKDDTDETSADVLSMSSGNSSGSDSGHDMRVARRRSKRREMRALRDRKKKKSQHHGTYILLSDSDSGLVGPAPRVTHVVDCSMGGQQLGHQFRNYLLKNSLQIEMWDADSKLLLGTATMPLRKLLHNWEADEEGAPKTSHSFGLELIVHAHRIEAEPKLDFGVGRHVNSNQISHFRAEIGRLQVLCKCTRSPGVGDEDTGGQVLPSARPESGKQFRTVAQKQQSLQQHSRQHNSRALVVGGIAHTPGLQRLHQSMGGRDFRLGPAHRVRAQKKVLSGVGGDRNKSGGESKVNDDRGSHSDSDYDDNDSRSDSNSEARRTAVNTTQADNTFISLSEHSAIASALGVERGGGVSYDRFMEFVEGSNGLYGRQAALHWVHSNVDAMTDCLQAISAGEKRVKEVDAEDDVEGGSDHDAPAASNSASGLVGRENFLVCTERVRARLPGSAMLVSPAEFRSVCDYFRGPFGTVRWENLLLSSRGLDKALDDLKTIFGGSSVSSDTHAKVWRELSAMDPQHTGRVACVAFRKWLRQSKIFKGQDLLRGPSWEALVCLAGDGSGTLSLDVFGDLAVGRFSATLHARNKLRIAVERLRTHAHNSGAHLRALFSASGDRAPDLNALLSHLGLALQSDLTQNESTKRQQQRLRSKELRRMKGMSSRYGRDDSGSDFDSEQEARDDNADAFTSNMRKVQEAREQRKRGVGEALMRARRCSHITLHTAHGEPSFFEYEVDNPYPRDERFRVTITDPQRAGALQLVRSKRAWDAFRAASGRDEIWRMSTEDELVGEDNTVVLSKHETVSIPFVFVSNHRDSDGRRGDDVESSKRTISVTIQSFRYAQEVSSLQVHVRPRAGVVHRVIRFFAPHDQLLHARMRLHFSTRGIVRQQQQHGPLHVVCPAPSSQSKDHALENYKRQLVRVEYSHPYPAGGRGSGRFYQVSTDCDICVVLLPTLFFLHFCAFVFLCLCMLLLLCWLR